MQKARGLPLESVWLFIQAAVVGAIGGTLGVGFRLGAVKLQTWLMGEGAPVALRLEPWQSLLYPAAGGLLAGLVLWTIGFRRGPFGINDLVTMAATRHGKINPLHSFVQICSSGLSIASGGSIGREGANSQLGATVASVLGHWIPNSPRSRTVLLGCGIAAGMAGAYKAPIAGAIFVMEVVLGNFAMDVLAPLVVASVISTLITVAVFGRDPLYALGGELDLMDPPLVFSAIVLGGICGFGSVFFRRSLLFGRQAFAKLPTPLPVRMMLGGLIVGAIGIWLPQTWGNGQNTIFALATPGQRPAFWIMAALVLFKVVATSSTAGSGGLGGVFTPNLVVGAACGVAFASVVDLIAPGDHHTEFALVGMAGLCAATTHAPITAIILIFEMTNDYDLVLPLMLCSIIASVTARLLDKDSIYTARMREAGHDVIEGLEELAIHRNYVRDIMRASFNAVTETAPLDEILELFNKSREGTVYVIKSNGELDGLIQLHDIKQYINDPTLASVVIAHDLTRPAPMSLGEESLAQVIERFDDPDLDELPVVTSLDAPHLLGRITRRDLVTCLSEEVLGQRSMRAKLKSPGDEEATYVQLPEETEIVRFAVPPNLIDRSLQSLDLPQETGLSVMLLVRRDSLGREERELPKGTSILDDSTDMVVLGPMQAIARFKEAHGID